MKRKSSTSKHLWSKGQDNGMLPDGRYIYVPAQGQPIFLTPGQDGVNIREIAFDRWNATMMVQALQDDGFTLVPFGQGFKDMSPPTKELMRLVLEHKINHGGHPILRWNMDNAYVRTDPAGNIKLDKEKSTEKIDGAVAMVMGLDRAMKNNSAGSIYDSRDMLTLDW